MVGCRCPCHHDAVGNLRDAEQRGDADAIQYFRTDDHLDIPPLVDIASQVDALLASGCTCMKFHVTLPAPRPRYKPPTPWNPQADGDIE